MSNRDTVVDPGQVCAFFFAAGAIVIAEYHAEPVLARWLGRSGYSHSEEKLVIGREEVIDHLLILRPSRKRSHFDELRISASTVFGIHIDLRYA